MNPRNPLFALALALIVGCDPAPSTAPPASAPGASPSVAPPPSQSAAIPLVIDTDMAPDDVVAIASLLRDPAVEVLAITVTGTGEAHCPGGMFVARSIVTMLRTDPVPVACGARSPLGDAEPFPDAWRAGADAGNGLRLVSPAFGPDARSSEELLVELSAAEAAAGRRLAILTLGTLTNLAGAAGLDPTLPDRVRVVSMLGAVGVPGNAIPADQPAASPMAEWNAHADPTAVRLVLEAGFDLTLVPLDATNDVPLTPDLFGRLEADHAAGPADLVYELWARNPWMTAPGYYVWDPLAAAVVRDPTLVTTRETRLRVVEGAGLDGGRLVEDAAGALVTIAVSADRVRFEDFLLASLRFGEPRANAFTRSFTVRVTAGPGTCDVAFEPATPAAGVVRLEARSTSSGTGVVAAFNLGAVTWAEIEAFAAAPDFEAGPPPAPDIASVELAASGTATAWGAATAGPMGVACLMGSFDDATILVRGPFEVGP